MDGYTFREFVQNVHNKYPQCLHFSICCLSAFVGETVTYPLDIIKTRLQVAGQHPVKSSKLLFRPLVISIVKNEGVLSFWQGLSPALYRHFLYTGARMPIYELIRNYVFEMPPASFRAQKISKTKTDKQSQSKSVLDKTEQNPTTYLWSAAAGGIISGATAQFICSPADLLKVRLQTERRKKLLLTTNTISSKSSSKTPITMRHLIREAGFLGLWRGGLPNVQRAALVNMGEMTTYDTAKRWLQLKFGLTDGPLLHGSASIMSGFVSAVLGTPADMIKSRMMNQKIVSSSGTTLPPLYSGMIDCATKVIRNEGFFTLYRGFFLIWGRMAPWSLTFWLTYENLREFTGAGGF